MALYIYYRVRPDQAQAALRGARRLLARVGERTGVTGSLMIRSDAAAQPVQTWMEVYDEVPSALCAVLDEELPASGLLAAIDGPRHSERFELLGPG